MDMAMADFDGAREYLMRHQVHELWEACVAELVLRKCNTKAAITDCIVEVVTSAEKKKSDPNRQVIFAVGLSETQFADVCKEVCAELSSVCSLVVAQPSDTYRTIGTQAIGAPRDVVVITGFPRTITEAVSFDSTVCHAAQCIVFGDAASLNNVPATSPAALAIEAKYLEHVNPVASYYAALGKTTHIAVDDAKKSPHAALRAEIESLAKKVRQ